MQPRRQRSLQQERLRRLLEHAYSTVPFYRKRFDDAGVHPSQIHPGQPLPIPATTRDMMREQAQATISSAYNLKDLAVVSSNGTAGSPTIFRRDIEGLRDKVALNLHLNQWADYDSGDSVMLLGDPQRDLTVVPSWKWRMYDRVLMRRNNGPMGSIDDEETLQRFHVLYEKQRPKVLYGCSTAIASFASHLQASGMRHRPQAVIATAEALNDSDRKLIESVFGGKLFVHYGRGDIGMVGAECSDHEGVHLHPWGVYMEFDPIGDTPDGPAYRMLATDLLNYGQPLIRYDTGDCVTMAEQLCSCGRWFPLVRHIPGRIAANIKPAVAVPQPAFPRSPAAASASAERVRFPTPGAWAS